MKHINGRLVVKLMLHTSFLSYIVGSRPVAQGWTGISLGTGFSFFTDRDLSKILGLVKKETFNTSNCQNNIDNT